MWTDNTVLGCGGRDFDDRELVFATLDAIHAARAITQIVHGACGVDRSKLPQGRDAVEAYFRKHLRGADRFVHEWAMERVVPVSAYPADWSRGRGDGPRRNGVMLTKETPGLVVAFAGGSGTADMVRKAKAAGVAVKEIGNG